MTPFRVSLQSSSPSPPDSDEYEKPASAHEDLPNSEHDEYYASCTFDEEAEEDGSKEDDEEGEEDEEDDAVEEEEDTLETDAREPAAVYTLHQENVLHDHLSGLLFGQHSTLKSLRRQSSTSASQMLRDGSSISTGSHLPLLRWSATVLSPSTVYANCSRR
jgi:hypothetical protein